MRSTVASAIMLMLALNIPATVGLIVLAQPIIALIFEHGNFTASDTAATSLALRYYAIGLVGYSVVRIVSPAFYALHLSRIPVAASVTSVVVNVGLNVVLVRVMGYAGLALGTSLAAIVNAALQVLLLRSQLGGIQSARISMTFLKVSLAAVAMGVAAWFAEIWLRHFLPGGTPVIQAVRVLGAIVAALAVLTLAATLLRVPEYDEAQKLVLGRLRRLAR
jgi:putative peptidoglycan lipid II flippase